MAQIRYRRIPELELVDLQDVDLYVLDVALANLRDAVRKNNSTIMLSDYQVEALVQLHQQVVIIKSGEELVEGDGAE